jgi:RNA polymerase sigma-70 factor (ECF subfamily)
VRSPAAPIVGTELDLITQAQNGNRQAFSELVRWHREGVVNVVYRMCGDPYLAEDMAQNAFIRAWSNLNKYKPMSSFRNWLYRIAANATVDYLRKEKETTELSEASIAAQDDGPEESVLGKERAECVKEAVLSLPPASRAVLVLREYEKLSYQEIAETLGLPKGTVMSRLNYARKRLFELLSPFMEVE